MESVRRLANLGLGLLDITEEKARIIADELVKRGEARSEKPGQLVKEIMARGEEVRKALQKQIDGAVQRAIGAAGLARAGDIEALKSRLDELESKLSS